MYNASAFPVHRIVLPKEVRRAALCLCAFAILNLIVVTLMVSNQSELADTLREANPEFSFRDVEAYASGMLIGGVLVYLCFAVVSIWLALMVGEGRNWARVAVTGLLIVNLLISVFLFAAPFAGLPQRIVHVISALLKLFAIGMLWLPESSREYFATRTANRRERLSAWPAK
jgi:cytochrome c biogenesis protein CcdA